MRLHAFRKYHIPPATLKTIVDDWKDTYKESVRLKFETWVNLTDTWIQGLSFFFFSFGFVCQNLLVVDRPKCPIAEILQIRLRTKQD